MLCVESHFLCLCVWVKRITVTYNAPQGIAMHAQHTLYLINNIGNTQYHPCLKTYSDHLWLFDNDSIVWNLSRSFWSSHAQSSWLLISMFTEKATRSLFGSCPLLVVYHSDVSIKSLSDCLSLLTAPFQKRPASPARAPPPTWCATDLPSTDPARKTNSFAGWSKGCQ